MFRYFLYFILFFISGCTLNTQQSFKTPQYAQFKFEQNVSILPKLDENFFIKNNYKKNFFRPWHSDFKKLKNEDLFWAFKMYKNQKNQFYFYNKQKISQFWFDEQIKNSNINHLGSINKKALIIQNSLIRNLPTSKAILKNPFEEGEGLPFDYAQNGILNIGSAILVSHYSKDKRYAFVMSENGFGFIKANDFEFISDHRAKIYENLNFITPLKEKTPIFDTKGNFLFQTRVGAIYPYYKKDKNYYYGKIGSYKYKAQKTLFSTFPMQLNDKNLKNQISQILNLPYGWGGYDFERDCSLFTRDLFSAFGIYMPRNSYAQITHFDYFDISKLNQKQKEDFLDHFAKPYLSLLYFPGHIMLYSGKINNTHTVLHSAWGVKGYNNTRLLISQSAITSLQIGKDQADIPNKNLYISKLSKIAFINLNIDEKNIIESYLKNIF